MFTAMTGLAAQADGVDRDRYLFTSKAMEAKKRQKKDGNATAAAASGKSRKTALGGKVGWPRVVQAGLLAQHSRVSVKCFKPKLVGLLKTVERHYGKKPIITSGYRSPAHNRRVRGARRSLHLRCQAADIQVPGVSKASLARFLRSLPGRGGVGLYCRSRSVHIDVGQKRDWYWGCGRKKRSRKNPAPKPAPMVKTSKLPLAEESSVFTR